MRYCRGFCCVFFKQKTAYEMRISDWISDVCSSGLKIDWCFFVEPGLAPVALARDRAGCIDEAPGDSAVFVDEGRKADMARDLFFGAFRQEIVIKAGGV